MIRSTFKPLKQLNRWALLGLLLSLFAWAALASPFYFTGAHDGRHSLFYQLQFTQGVADGQWFPRWGPDFGFGRGYPFFILYAPLTSYTVQAAKAWGMGLVASVKVSWALGFVLGTAGMFRLAKAWWRDDRAAFVAALLFTFVPYRLVDIYVRAAMAEFWSLALFPWLLLSFHRLIQRPGPVMLAGSALLYAALILTHTATALLFSPFLGAAILLELVLEGWRERGQPGGAGHVRARVLAVAGALALGVATATIFWLPLLAEQRYIDVTQYVPENYNFVSQFTEFSQFLSPFWGFGFAVPGPADGMSFQLGVVPVLLTLVALWLLVGRRVGREASARLIWALVSLTVVLGAMTALALPVWEGFPLAAMVQFPWRMLGLSAVLVALIGGGAARGLLGVLPRPTGLHPAVALLVLLTLTASAHYTLPLFTPPSDQEETLLTILDFQRQYRDMAGRLARSEVVPQESPMEAQYDALEAPQKFRVIAGEATIAQHYYGGSTVRARIETGQPAQVEFMTYDYPGWTLYRDGQRLPHQTYPPEGTIAFEVPPGSHEIVARFEDTPLRRAAMFISLVALTVALGLLVWGQRRGRMREEATHSFHSSL